MYIEGYLELTKSSALGMYYAKNMFLGLAVEIVEALQDKEKNPREAANRRHELHVSERYIGHSASATICGVHHAFGLAV